MQSNTPLLSSGLSNQARRQEKLRNTLRVLSEQGLSFHDFVLGVITSTDATVRLTSTKWLASHTSKDADKFGPALLTAAVTSAVRERAGPEDAAAFDHRLIQLCGPALDKECRSAASDVWLRASSGSSSDDGEREDVLTGNFREIKEHYEAALPLSSLVMSYIAGPSRGAPNEDKAQSPVDASGKAALLTAESIEDMDQPAPIVPLSRHAMHLISALSCLLLVRNRKANRFQMNVGVLFGLLRVPSLAHNITNFCGFAVSSRTANRAMEAVSQRATQRGRELIKSNMNRTVFLFDNVNIYIRHALQSLTSTNTSVALTSRTLFSLPPDCTPVSPADLASLASLDRQSVSIQLLLDDVGNVDLPGVSQESGTFLRRAAILHMAGALLPLMNIDESRRRSLSASLRRRQQKHSVDELLPHRTSVVPLRLLNMNEGTVDGTRRVLDATLTELQIKKDGSSALLVAGDLLTVMNVTAAQYAASFEREHLQLQDVFPVAGPWHLLLNWLYMMFKTYASGDRGTSLERFRRILGRGKTDLDMQRPQFEEGWRLLEHAWQGRILSALQHELEQAGSRFDDWSPSAEDFFKTISTLYERHFSPTAVDTARTSNDNSRATSVLFLRDCVLGWEYNSAIKAGDIGRMAEVEKSLCLAFYGAGQTKYGALLLDRALVDHRLPKLAKTLRAAQLVNIHGHRGGWQGADHFQELLNRQLKLFDVSHSTDQAVVRFEDRISAFVGVGNTMVSQAKQSMSLHSGSRRKKRLALHADIRRLAEDARECGLHTAKPQTHLQCDILVTSNASDTKLTAAQQAKAVWNEDEGEIAAIDLVDEGYLRLLDSGIDRYKSKSKQRVLRTRDEDVCQLATGRESPDLDAPQDESQRPVSTAAEGPSASTDNDKEEVEWAERRLLELAAERGRQDDYAAGDDSSVSEDEDD
ncbi:hypothetical protein OC834_007215 [Tilletia horrida]|nr:hypothetical protein OC834_007215 [Tilletia horrida]